MDAAQRFLGLGALASRVSSGLLILVGAVMFYPAHVFWKEGQPVFTALWVGGAMATIAYGTLALLCLLGVLKGSMEELVRPLLKLGAIVIAIAGGAWAVGSVVRWQQTGDLEAYAVVFGALMLLQGTAAFWELERPAPR